MVVALPTIIDPLLPSRARVYGSDYPLGYLVLLLALPVFIFTFVGNKKTPRPLFKGVYTFLALFCPMVVSLPNFKPKPHYVVVGYALLYGFVLACTSYVHSHSISLHFVDDESIDIRAKIERLKFEHEVYYKILFLFFISSTAVAAATVLRGGEAYKMVYDHATPEEIDLITNDITVRMAYFVVLVIMFVREMLGKMQRIASAILKIKRVQND